MKRCAKPIFISLLLSSTSLVLKADTFVNYSIPDLGGISIESQGAAGPLSVGYALIQPTGGIAPAGVAVYGLRQNGVLVSEAGVPSSSLISAGRFYARVDGPVNTGLAIANPNTQDATISFFVTDLSGRDFGAASTVIPALGQQSVFLSEPPFNVPNGFEGTFTFSSNVPVGVVALRGFANERSEFLVTTLPVSGVNSSSTAPLIFPHFAAGGGWTTQIVLVNPTGSPLSGTIQAFSSLGAAAVLTLNAVSGSTFSYSIPAKTAMRFQTSASAGSMQVGSVVVTPQPGTAAPTGLIIFTFNNGGFTVSEAGVSPSASSSAFRIFAEASDPASFLMTGMAVANLSANPAEIHFDLMSPDGAFTGLTAVMTIPAHGQLAQFLNEIPGFESLPRPFKGVLRISTKDPAARIAVTGLRSRRNERNDFMITTTPAADESAVPAAGMTIFPHVVDGGGYTTQFTLFSETPGQSHNGLLRMFRKNGQAFDLNLGAMADLAVTQQGSAGTCSLIDNGCAGLSFQTTVTNRGPGIARSVTLTDFLPVDPAAPELRIAAVDVAQVTSVPPGVACSPARPVTIVSCAIGDMAGGESRSIQVSVNVRSNVQGRVLTNVTNATSITPDTVAANGRASFDVAVVPETSSDLVLTTTAPASVRAGNPITLTMQVVNRGPTTATEVAVTHAFSGSAQLVFPPGQSSPQCLVSGSAMTCNVGTLPVNGSVSLKVVVQSNSAALLRDDIEVNAAEADPEPQNNSKTVTVTVNP